MKACFFLTGALQAQKPISYRIQAQKANIHIIIELRNEKALLVSAIWRSKIIQSNPPPQKKRRHKNTE